MTNQFVTNLNKMNDSITEGNGELDVNLRANLVTYARELTLNQAINSDQIPEALRPYLNKVILHAYKTTDNDIEQLKNSGYSEDEIFELTISAAFGAGYARYLQGIALLQSSEELLEDHIGEFAFAQ